jgi:hypothetical protein
MTLGNFVTGEDGKLIPAPSEVTVPTDTVQTEVVTPITSESVQTQAPTETPVEKAVETVIPQTEAKTEPIVEQTIPTYSFEKEFQEKTKGKFKSIDEVENLYAEYEN